MFFNDKIYRHLDEISTGFLPVLKSFFSYLNSISFSGFIGVALDHTPLPKRVSK